MIATESAPRSQCIVHCFSGGIFGSAVLYREDLAFIHDARFGETARSAAPVLLSALARAGLEDGLVVDLGCGSGIFAEPIAAAGYDVLGVDVSVPMFLPHSFVPGCLQDDE